MKIKATKVSGKKPSVSKQPLAKHSSAEQLKAEAVALVDRALKPERPARRERPVSGPAARQQADSRPADSSRKTGGEQPQTARPKAAKAVLRPARFASHNRVPDSKPDSKQEEPREPSTLRLFYALRVPTEIANPLAELQRQLKGNWRKVRSDQMHVTLCYLPSVPPERVEDLKRLGVELMHDLAPMQVSLRGTGYFPNEGSPRVWFVKVEAGGLTELAQTLRTRIQALGIATEEVPFKAHITLARKKGPAPRVPPKIFDLAWTAAGGTLYRSILRKTGPIYEVESTFRFRGTEPLEAQPPVASLPFPTDSPANHSSSAAASIPAPSIQEPS